MMTLRFLLLEDNPWDAEKVETMLRDGGIPCKLLTVKTRSDLISALETDRFDLILSDYRLPEFDGIAALEIACNLCPDVPFIFVSASGDAELAIDALERGATGFVLKHRLERLGPCVQRALRDAQERREHQQTELILVEQKQLLELIASGQPIEDCLSAVCDAISKLNSGTRACFLLTDAQRTTFPRSITPDFPRSFGEGLKDAPINDLCIGTCGEAVYRGEPITCADIAHDERWSQAWRALCIAHGILACHSKPVIGADGLPLGSLMLCFSEARMPTDWEYQLADFGTQVASIAFERDRSHLALRESEAKYRSLFESIDEGFCICEMLFDQNGEPQDYRFLEVNAVFAELTGLEQATGKTARELVPDLEAFWIETYGRVVQTGEAVRFEQQSIVMNSRWFDVNAFCIGEPKNHQFGILFTNISDRKKVEQERERFLAVGSDLQLTIGFDHKLKWVSPTFEQTLGWTANEMIGQPWFKFAHPDNIDGFQQTGSKGIDRQLLIFENRYRHKDGSYRWLFWKVQPYPEDRLVYAVAVDITVAKRNEIVRRQTEQALRESEEQLRLASEGANLGLWYWNAKENALTWTDRAKVMFGLPADTEMTMQVFLDAVHPDDRSFVQTVVSELQSGQAHTEIEYRTRWTDGTVRWILARGDSAYDADGTLMATRGVLMDITDRKQAEAALRESEARFRSFATNGNDVIWITHANDYRLIYVSPSYEQVWGRPATEIYADLTRFLETIHPDDRQGIQTGWQQCTQGGFSQEYRVIRPDGSIVWIHDRGFPIYDDQGELLYLGGIAEDISERKQVETAIQQLNQQLTHRVNELQTLFDLLPIGVAIAEDPVCRTIRANAYMSELLRLPVEANASHSAPVDERPLYRLCRDGQEISVETLPMQSAAIHNIAIRDEVVDLVHPDGTVVKLLCYASPLLDAQGRVRGALGAFVDITQRVLDENTLRQSEERFRTIVQTANEGVWLISTEAQTLYINDRMAEILGCTTEEIFDRPVLDFCFPEDVTSAQERIRCNLQGNSEQFDFRFRRRDGREVLVLAGTSPIRDGQGTIVGALGMFTDVTDRRRADKRLHLLYETTRDLLATDQPMQLMHNLFRKLSEQLELHSYYNYMVEAKDNRPILHLRNYGGISEEAAQSIEWIEWGQYLCGIVAQERHPLILNRAQITTHPNAKLVCSMGVTAYAGYPLMAQGRLLGTLSFASLTRTGFTSEEIDLLQSTCEQVAIALERANLITSIQQQAEQLQQANRIKDEFLAVLSHELRSPLNPILGWAKLLQTGNLDKTKTAQALSVIERNAKLQSELIEDLLDVSRILRGKLSLNVSPVALVPTIQAAMETVRLAAEAKSIQIQANLDSNTGQVSGDANRLQQVVWNLLSNAVKFTPEGGRVDIQLERVGSQAQISVSDTGKGIHPDFLPNVFDYFRQEDGATTRRFGGLGLGLAIVRHLVELHGGTVRAKSLGEGQGATFTVRLPLMPHSPQTNSEKQPSERSLNLQGIQVLVVDDADDTREFIAFLLEMHGANVTAAASAVKALATLAQYRADVLVSDIGMPEVDGYALMRQVRALPPEQGGQMPAIALTAYAGEIDYQQAMLVGFQKHVPKPVDPAKLVEAIAELVYQCQSPS